MGTAYLIAGEIGTFLIPGVFWLLGVVFAKKVAGWVLWGIGDVVLFLMMLGAYGEVMANAYNDPVPFSTQLLIGMILAGISLLLMILRRKKADKTRYAQAVDRTYQRCMPSP